jgi:phosphoglycolate phosphatase-like HAD superfamily hydrolase
MRYDCALFDIDGVLVDIRKSYNSAIRMTVEFMLKKLAGRSFRGIVTDQIILKFRQSGGFNNDTDTTYAIVLATLARQPASVAAGRKILLATAANADDTGVASVEKYLDGFGVAKWKKILGYPAPVKECMLARVFDEYFYGPRLFRMRNETEPRYWRGKPLISNDVLVVSAATMRRLHEIFGGNLAVVSGRSRLAAEYSLGGVMKYFDLDACVFLEDESREYAKPSPYAIKRAMESMGARTALYSGDSAEDHMMAGRAEAEAGVRIQFVGIYGFSPDPRRTLENFKQLGIKATAKSVNQLPSMIEKGI